MKEGTEVYKGRTRGLDVWPSHTNPPKMSHGQKQGLLCQAVKLDGNNRAPAWSPPVHGGWTAMAVHPLEKRHENFLTGCPDCS